jgi:hypothetical protein
MPHLPAPPASAPFDLNHVLPVLLVAIAVVLLDLAIPRCTRRDR